MGLRETLGGGNTRSPGSNPYATGAAPQPKPEVGSQVQYDDVAAMDSISRNATGAANKLSEARHRGVDISAPEYDALRQVAEKGLLESDRGGLSKLIGIIDGPRQAINLGIQDVVGGREEDKGFESPKITDYVDAVFGGFKNEEELKFRTGLEPVSGSAILDLFGWKHDDDNPWGERMLRGAAQFGVEVLTDPLTYVTFGLSGLGKKVALESAKKTGDRVIRNVLGKTASTKYEKKLLGSMDQIVSDFSDDMVSRFGAGEFDQINSWMKIKHGADTPLQISENATVQGAQKFLQENAEDIAEMALQSRVADDIIKPVLNKRFGDIDIDANEDMDAFIRGGIRVTFPFMKGGMMGGYVIPNTQGLGRQLFGDNVRKVFDNVLPKMGVDSKKLRESIGDLAGFWDVDQPLIKAVKNGDIDPWQYTYIRNLMDQFANDANKAEVLSFINSSKTRLEEVMHVKGLDSDSFDDVLKYVRDKVNDRMGININKHGENIVDAYNGGRPTVFRLSEKYGAEVAEQADELANLMHMTFNKYRTMLRELAPQLDEKIFERGFPQMISGSGNRFLQQLARQGGADSMRELRKMAANGDHGGYLVAELLGSLGGGGSLEAQLGSHARIGKQRYGRQAATVLNDLDPSSGNIIFMDRRREIAEGGNIADILAHQNEAGVIPDWMSVEELNDLMMPHFVRLAEKHGLSVKDLDGKIFSDNPMEVANKYIEAMHEAVSTFTLTSALQDVGLMIPNKTITNVQDVALFVRRKLAANDSKIRAAIDEAKEKKAAAQASRLKRAVTAADAAGFKADNLGSLRELEEFVNQPTVDFLAARRFPDAAGTASPDYAEHLHRMNLDDVKVGRQAPKAERVEEFLGQGGRKDLREYALIIDDAPGTTQDFKNEITERIIKLADAKVREPDEVAELGGIIRDIMRKSGKDGDKFLPTPKGSVAAPDPVSARPIGNKDGHRIEEYIPEEYVQEEITFDDWWADVPRNAKPSDYLKPGAEAPWGGRMIADANGVYHVPRQWVIDNVAGPDDLAIARGQKLGSLDPVDGSRASDAARIPDKGIVDVDEFDADILENGIQRPLNFAVTPEGRLVMEDGHHRLASAERHATAGRSGFDTVPVNIRKGEYDWEEGWGFDIKDKLDVQVTKEVPSGLVKNARVQVIRDAEGRPIASIKTQFNRDGTIEAAWGVERGVTARQMLEWAPDIWRNMTRGRGNKITKAHIEEILNSNLMTDAGARLFKKMIKDAFSSMPDNAIEAITRKPAEFVKFESQWYDFMEEYEDFQRLYTRSYGPEGYGDLADDPNFRQIAGEDADVVDQLDRMRRLAADLDVPGLTGIFPGADVVRATRVSTQPDFVDPSLFKLGGDAVENMIIQKDMARWMRNLAANNAALWTPQGVAVAKANMNNVVRIWKGLATVARPSFHLRNTFSAAWNNMAVGVRTKDYMFVRNNALKMRREMINNNKSFAEAIATLPAEARPYFTAAQKNQIFDGFATTEFRKLTDAQKDEALKFFKLVNPADADDFALTRMGSMFMESIEDFMRMSAFVRWYDPLDPSTAKVAKEMVEAVHFNYAKLTPFETGVKTVVPFFVWMRRNIPLQMQLMLENPKIAQRYRNLLSSSQGQMDPMEQDEFGESKYLSELAVGTNIVFNEDTPQWARLMFDPDLPIRDLLDLDPTSVSSAVETFKRMIGPQYTLPFNLAEQGDYGNVNAPAPIHLVLKSLAQVGLYDETSDGNVRIPYWVRTMYDTALPFARETVDPLLDPLLGSLDPNRAQRQGINLEEDSTLEQIGKGVLGPFGRAAGFTFQTPLDTKSANYDTDREIQRMIYELRLRGDL